METFDARQLIPPHKVTRPEQVYDLADSMLNGGWQGPPLIGYYWRGRLQLLSGTHRRAAAELTNTPVPVVIRRGEDVWLAWGQLDAWKEIMNECATNF